MTNGKLYKKVKDNPEVTIAAPTFAINDTPVSGTATAKVGDKLTINAEVENILYNVDSGDPSTDIENNEELYFTAIELNEEGTFTYKAIAVDDAMVNTSEVSTLNLTVTSTTGGGSTEPDPDPQPGDSYQIVFANGNSTSADGAAYSSSNISDALEQGKEYVNSITDYSYAYFGKSGFGLKLGTGSYSGNVTLNLSDEGQVKAVKIVANAASYNTSDKASLVITLNGEKKLTQALSTTDTDLHDYEFSLDEGIVLKTITLASSQKRANIKGLTIYYEADGPKVYEAEFDDVMVYVGKAATLAPKNNEAPVAINYEIATGDEYISLKDDVVSGLAVGNATVTASWGGGETGYEEGSATINVAVEIEPTKDPELSFRYTTVYGKAGVGFVGQAVYHVSPGEITYTSSNPEVVDVNPTTGMYESGKPCNVGTTEITATIKPCGEYLGDSKSYTVIIETMEQENTTTEPSEATFNFADPTTLTPDKTITIPTKNGTGENVPGIVFSNKEVELVTVRGEESTNGPRLWFSANSNYQYRIYKKNILTISTSENSSIKKMVFTMGKDNLASGAKMTSVYGSIQYNSSTSSPFNNLTQSIEIKDEGVTSITFTVDENIFFSDITVYVEKTVTGPSEKPHHNMYFNDEDRIINAFVGDAVRLPELKFEDSDFDTAAAIVYTVDDESDDKGAIDCNIYTDPEGTVCVEGLGEGVYTVRAAAEETENQTAAVAILRLNVFPRLTVLPSEDSDNTLADDPRTELPSLTLVHSSYDEDQGMETATIALPAVDDKYEYSTIHLQRVEILHGDEVTVYEVKTSEAAPMAAGESLDIAEMPATFDFSKDGYVKYSIRYADTYEIEEQVNVVLMPQAKVSGNNGNYTVTPTAGSTLYYKAYAYNPEIYVMPMAVDVQGWASSNEAKTFARTDMDGISDSDLYVVEYAAQKDISHIAEGEPLSDEGILRINADGGLSGIEDVAVSETDGEPIYYNLQGVRMSEPLAPGMYIRAAGSQAIKVVVK